MRRFLALIPVLVVMSVSCADDPPDLPLGADGKPDPVLAEGRDIYAERCQACHGGDGGGGVGAKLKNIEEKFTLDEQIAIINAGPGQMPTFSEILTEQEILAVARYTREVL